MQIVDVIYRKYHHYIKTSRECSNSDSSIRNASDTARNAEICFAFGQSAPCNDKELFKMALVHWCTLHVYCLSLSLTISRHSWLVWHHRERKIPLVRMIRTVCRQLCKSLLVTAPDSPKTPQSKSNYQSCTNCARRKESAACSMSHWSYEKATLAVIW